MSCTGLWSRLRHVSKQTLQLYCKSCRATTIHTRLPCDGHPVRRVVDGETYMERYAVCQKCGGKYVMLKRKQNKSVNGGDVA